MLVLTRTVGQAIEIDLTELLQAYAAGKPVEDKITLSLPKNQPDARVKLGFEADRRAVILRDDIKSRNAPRQESQRALAAR